MKIHSDPPRYGEGDASFRAAGELEGVRRLVDAFYDRMQSWPDAEPILSMHPADLEISRDKLTTFLCGWLGGPKEYAARFGPIRLPHAHVHLPIGERERDLWLACMRHAIAQQPFQESFRRYLYEQLCVPAERVRQVCEQRHGPGEAGPSSGRGPPVSR